MDSKSFPIFGQTHLVKRPFYTGSTSIIVALIHHWLQQACCQIPSGKLSQNYGKIHHAINGQINYFDRAIFNSFVCLPEGIHYICRPLLHLHISPLYPYCCGNIPEKKCFTTIHCNHLDLRYTRNGVYLSCSVCRTSVVLLLWC